MGGKSGTTTQSVSIPPEVLARYNAVNTRAEQVAQTPFQAYGGQFVAPITATQQAGINNVSGAANMAQPYFQQAQQQQQQAYQQAMPYLQNAMQAASTGLTQASNQFGQSQGYLTNASAQGQFYGGQAYTPIAGALSSAQPYMQTAAQMTGQGLGAAAPLMGAAEGFLGGGTQAVNPQEFGQAQINKYMSPYMRNVVEAQQALQQQESAAQRSALNSQAIGAGAFGGDRAGIAQANLARQQLLANQATLGNLLQQGYGQAAGMFQQQQGIDLQAQQANRAAQQFGSQQAANLAQQRFAQQLGAGQQMAGLGQQQFGQQIGAGQALAGLGQQMYAQNLGAAQAAQGLGAAQYGMGAQQAGLEQGLGAAMFGMGTQQAQGLAGLGAQQQAAALQGAQAQIGAGTLEQQTQQAEATAQYQQFLQERGYPFQVAQFLANIAMGTGALSGSTTTTTQPMPFMSDRRMKKDVKEIGETHDGLPIYSFKYKGGDEQPRIGVMADEAREKHPDAVHRYGGIDAVDYEKIANRASEGGGVMPHRAGQGYAPGGVVSDQDIASIIAMQKEFLGPHGKGGLYGQSQHNLPGGAGIVPQKGVHVARLQTAGAPPRQTESGLGQAIGAVEKAEGLGEKLLGEKGYFGKQGIIRRGAGAVKELVSPTSSIGQKESSAAQSGQTSGGNRVPQPASARTSQDNTQDAIKTALLSRPEDELFDPESLRMAAYGGGIRPAKAQGGYLEEKVLPYQSEFGYGPEDVNEEESKTPIEPLKPGQAPGQSGGSGLGNLASAIGTAGTIAKAGTAVAEFLPALFALFPSDERLKTDMKRVGQLDNGQPVYKYRFGKGPMQLGLSAQNVSEYGDPSAVYRDKDGFLMLDYDRATKNYGGGIRPAFQEGGEAKKEYTLDDYLNSIASIESGGRYEAVGPRTKSGDRAYGKYQVMGANIPAWSERHLGQRLTPQEFLANEEAQEKIARGEFGSYLNKYGTPEDAASMWFSGKPLAQAGNRADVLGTTVPAYINKFRAGLGLGSYSGAEGEPRRQVAGAESVVEGGRRTDSVDGQRVSSGGIQPPTEYQTGKPFESWGDFATSRQFLIPLLSGLGGMARSKSLYLGPAIMEGLGAAAESYAGLEKPITEGQQQREVTRTQQAVTAKGYQNIARDALVVDPTTGIILGVRVYIDGKAKQIPVSEFNRALREGRPYAIDPQGTTVSEPFPEKAPAGVGTPAGTPEAGAAGPQAPEQAPAYRTIDQDTANVIKRNAEFISSGGTTGISVNDPALNPFPAAASRANEALNNLQSRNMYANAFATMDKNNLGQFQQNIQIPLADYINSTIRAANQKFGTQIGEIMPDQVGQANIIRKLSTQLAGLRDASTGQTSYASFSQWLNSVPTVANDPQSAAALIADLYVTQQMEIDKNNFLNNARSYALEKGYVNNENQAQFIGRGLENQFVKKTAQQYTAEKNALAKMLFEPLQIRNKKTGEIQNTTVVGYLTKTGGRIPPSVRAQIENQYGKDIIRYFSGQ